MLTASATAASAPTPSSISAKGRAKIPAFELASQSGFDKNGNDGRLIDYDAPEEARGEPPDDRSDVYSVGAILYETLTTRRPMHRGASAPSASNPKVPKELDEIVLKALSPNADARFQSAVAFAGALRGSIAVLDALRCCRRGRGTGSDAVDQHRTRALHGRRHAGRGRALAWWFWS